MKKFFAISICLILVIGVILFGTDKKADNEYLRIHIRANSNEEIDQRVKYKVKDAVVSALIPVVAECETKKEAEIEMSLNFDLIENAANAVLFSNGFSYSCKAKLATEKFPTRAYGDLTLESGFYDALILELGTGTGDNWWCVVYPPLCFLSANPYGDSVVYKSKILEIIRKIIK
ncbi:MAG: stage II sporulation protein R [Clostridia bacterium]